MVNSTSSVFVFKRLHKSFIGIPFSYHSFLIYSILFAPRAKSIVRCISKTVFLFFYILELSQIKIPVQNNSVPNRDSTFSLSLFHYDTDYLQNLFYSFHLNNSLSQPVTPTGSCETHLFSLWHRTNGHHSPLISYNMFNATMLLTQIVS